MSFIRVSYLEPCRVASFHVTSSLTPEEEAHSLFLGWAERKGLLPEHRFIPLIGFNNPWGPVGEKRGYELWCVLDNLGDIDLHDTIVKEFSGGLYVVITIPGLDRIMQGRELANKWLKDHPKYKQTTLRVIGTVSIRLLNTKSYIHRRQRSLKIAYSTTTFQSKRNPDTGL